MTIFPGLNNQLCIESGLNSISHVDGVPSDSVRVRVQDATHIATLIVSIILYGFLFAFAIGCLLFNILLRNRRYVQCLTLLTPVY